MIRRLTVIFFCFLLMGADYLGQKRMEKTMRFMQDKFQITLFGEEISRQAARSAIDAAFDRLKELEATFDSSNPNSAVSQIRNLPSGKPLDIDPDVFEVLNQATAISKLTVGLYQISDKPLWELWCRARDQNQLPDALAIRQVLPVPIDQICRPDPLTKKIVFLRTDCPMMWEKIVPGYAVDQIATILKTHNIRSAVISYSALTRTLGNPGEGSTWRLGIEHPRKPEEVAAIVESPGELSVSTIGDYVDFMTVDSKRTAFIFDATTGRPPTNTVAGVTVIAKHAAVAQALSYTFFILGPEKSFDLAGRFKEESVEAVFFEETVGKKLSLSASENSRLLLKEIEL